MSYLNGFILVNVILLASCGSITYPITGKTTDGINWVGSTTASVSGADFVINGNGVSCTGTYDPLSKSKRIYSDFTCSDGRTGKLAIVKKQLGKSGQAIADFSDGTKGNFVYGGS